MTTIVAADFPQQSRSSELVRRGLKVCIFSEQVTSDDTQFNVHLVLFWNDTAAFSQLAKYCDCLKLKYE